MLNFLENTAADISNYTVPLKIVDEMPEVGLEIEKGELYEILLWLRS